MGRGVDFWNVWGKLGCISMVEVVLVHFLTETGW